MKFIAFFTVLLLSIPGVLNIFIWMNTSLIYSIIENCKKNGLCPVKYIADVLRKLVSGDMDYMVLLPMNIAK